MFLTAFVLIAVSGSAQIEHMSLAQDSSIVIDRVYAGVLSGTTFSTTSVTTNPSVSVRFGAMASWRLSQYIKVRSFGMFETDLTHSWGIQQFYVVITPAKRWSLTFGQMATPSTEQRPHPVSGGGQFETSTLGNIPGGAPGIKAKYLGPVTMGAGVAVRNGLTEYHATIEKGKHTLSGYYRTSGTSGVAYTYDGVKWYSVIVYKPHALISTTTVFTFSKPNAVFADVGYGIDSHSIVRMEGGIMRKFESTWIKGLFSLTIDYKARSVNGYVFVHL